MPIMCSPEKMKAKAVTAPVTANGRTVAPRANRAPHRASGSSATTTMPLVQYQSAGSQRLWGTPIRHDTSRAVENVPTRQLAATIAATMA